MNIILHADDFGYDEETTKATIELFDEGALTSATIMPNMPATALAIEYAKNHPEFSFGVHLTYVDGLLPLTPAYQIRTLVDDYAQFLPSREVRKKALTLRIRSGEIVSETMNQINRLRNSGVEISHLDSHGHLHKFPAFLLAMREVVKRTGIYKIRRVQNMFVHRPTISLSGILNSLFNMYIAKNFETTDYFYMPANQMDIFWGEAINRQMESLRPEATIEIGVHPGHVDAWRSDEYRDMLHFVQMINRDKHRFINWNNNL
ncbi:MAG: ChbG/HpnK family deacetylase [Mediterranea sp.]|nr:ChbG/HpnK family deacetylase [Mediterranea sp.]